MNCPKSNGENIQGMLGTIVLWNCEESLLNLQCRNEHMTTVVRGRYRTCSVPRPSDLRIYPESTRNLFPQALRFYHCGPLDPAEAETKERATKVANSRRLVRARNCGERTCGVYCLLPSFPGKLPPLHESGMSCCGSLYDSRWSSVGCRCFPQ